MYVLFLKDVIDTLVIGVSGSIIFIGHKIQKEPFSGWKIFYTLFTGALFAVYFGSSLCTWLKIENDKIGDTIEFLCGAFGTIIFEILLNAIVFLKENHKTIFKSILAKYLKNGK